MADHRGDVHTPPPAGLHHGAHHPPAQPERGGQVHINHRLPFVIAHPHEQVVAGDACVVDQNIHRPHRGDCGLWQRLDRRRICQIARHHKGARPEFRRQRLQRVHPRARQRHSRPSPVQRARNRRPNAPRSACDQGRFSGQIIHVVIPRRVLHLSLALTTSPGDQSTVASNLIKIVFHLSKSIPRGGLDCPAIGAGV